VSTSDTSLARSGVLGVEVVTGLGDVGSGGTGRGSVGVTGSVEVITVGGVVVRARGQTRVDTGGRGRGGGGRTESVSGSGRDSTSNLSVEWEGKVISTISRPICSSGVPLTGAPRFNPSRPPAACSL
jgi:hypothetical protein